MICHCIMLKRVSETMCNLSPMCLQTNAINTLQPIGYHLGIVLNIKPPKEAIPKLLCQSRKRSGTFQNISVDSPRNNSIFVLIVCVVSVFVSSL